MLETVPSVLVGVPVIPVALTVSTVPPLMVPATWETLVIVKLAAG
jgi:hypothetical protein